MRYPLHVESGLGRDVLMSTAPPIRGPARLVVAITTLATLGVVALARAQSGVTLPLAPWAAVAWLAGLVYLGRVYPVRLSNRTEFHLDVAAIFAAALLLPVLHVVAGIVVGECLAYLSRPVVSGATGSVLVFNAAQVSLAAGLAGAAYEIMDPVRVVLGPGAASWQAVAVAAAVFLVVNATAMAALLSAVYRSRPLATWFESLRLGLGLYAGMLGLGVALAAVAPERPAVALAVLIPLLGGYRAQAVGLNARRLALESLQRLADAFDERSAQTSGHARRVEHLAARIARRMGLPPAQVEAVAYAARLHELGRVGISDGLLARPRRLTGSELDEVRRHVVTGAEIVNRLPELSGVRETILFQHERIDGDGTFRLPGLAIPLGARILAVADAYDAMTSPRPHRPALSHGEAVFELRRNAGAQFDRAVVQAFLHLDVTPAFEPEPQPREAVG